MTTVLTAVVRRTLEFVLCLLYNTGDDTISPLLSKFIFLGNLNQIYCEVIFSLTFEDFIISIILHYKLFYYLIFLAICNFTEPLCTKNTLNEKGGTIF